MLDSTQTLALMTAMTRLRHFTAEEVAMHAGLSLTMARGFLREQTWAGVARQPGSHDGRPRRTSWTVHPDQIDTLAQAVADLRRQLTGRAVTHRAGVDLAETLEFALNAIEDGRQRGEDVSRETASARRYLRGLETATWDHQLEVEGALVPELARLDALRARCRELDIDRDSPSVGSDSPSVTTLARALLDWTVTMPRALPAGEQIPPWAAPGASPEVLANAVYRGVAGSALEDARAFFVPSLRALAILDANAGDPALRARLLDVTRRAMQRPHAAHMAPAACLLLCALDAFEAVDWVLPALMTPDGEPPAAGRALACAALARLTRPDEKGVARESAARACLYLLSKVPPELVRLIAPGALCATYADPMSILEQLVVPRDGEGEMLGAAFDAGAFVRTLAVAMLSLHRSNAGADLVERLASTARGIELIELMSAPQYRALIVRPDDQAGYVMRPAGELYSVVLPESALVVARTAHAQTLALMDRLSAASARDATLAPRSLTGRLSARKPAAHGLVKVDRP